MSNESKNFFSGRGAQVNPTNRFEKNEYGIEHWEGIDEPDQGAKKTKFIDVYPQSIVNKVSSPDVGMDFSLNPYQGCEHGCTYCYARPTHEYWGKSAGLDFERVIFVKKNAANLLRKAFEKKSWKVKPVVLSGNTDCYQPCERKFGITRELLEVFLAYQHPVGIITKNVLLERDLDIIQALGAKQLIKVNLSITTLNEDVRRKLEPRTATAKRKLALIEQLVALNIPVSVMVAPVIPAINDHEIMEIAKETALRGATGFHTHMVRLMGANASIFEHWLQHHFPDRKNKVIHQLKSIHGGALGSSVFGKRFSGEGSFAKNIRDMGGLARKKYFSGIHKVELRQDLFMRPGKGRQLDLFG